MNDYLNDLCKSIDIIIDPNYFKFRSNFNMLTNIKPVSLLTFRFSPTIKFSNEQSNRIPLYRANFNLPITSHSNSLLMHPRYSYFTLIDKPIQSITLNSIIQLGAQCLSYPFLQWSCPSQASIIVGGIVFRLIAQIASKFIQEMKFAHHENRIFYKIVQKVFLVDLQRDIKFYELDHRKAYLMQKYYKVSYLLKNAFTAYLGLNFFRACHFILQYEQFNSFHIHTVWVPTLASYDPSFTLPILTMGFTYLWLAKSRHPFIIHLTKPQNLLYRVNIAFMTGLLFVPLPTIYALGYISWMTGHLLIRTLEQEGSDLREQWRDLFGLNKKFIEQRDRKLVDEAKKQKNSKAQLVSDKNEKK